MENPVRGFGLRIFLSLSAMLRRLLIILLFIPAVVNAQVADTSRPHIKRQYTLSTDYSEEVSIELDTAFSMFHRHRLTDKFSPFNAYPGNYGLPLYQINFFDRITDPDKFLYRYYYPFMHEPSNPVFMDTQLPFTEFIFTFAGPRDRAEQTFRIRHSQNVSPKLNFGLIYDIVYSLGQYRYQRTDDKTFTLFSSYKGNRYELFLSGGINNIASYENGGVADMSQLETFDTRDVEVNLGGLNLAKNELKNRNLLLVQKYTLGNQDQNISDTVSTDKPTRGYRMNGTLSHILEIETNRKSYLDKYPMAGFYSSVFVDSLMTFDSLYQRSIKNTLRFDFTTDETRKFRLGGGVGLRNEIFKYSQNIPAPGEPLSDTAGWHFGNIVFVGRIFNDIGDKLGWSAKGELYLTGYRAGDFDLRGRISKIFAWEKGRAAWDIYGGMSSFKPSVWYERWGSNHFRWQNSFLKEFRLNAGTEFNYPARKTSLRFDYAIIDNYTDFGPDTLPSQYRGGLSVAALYLHKDFSLWKFHLSNDVLIQKSTNKDVLDLPLVTLKSSGYFEHKLHFKLTNGDLYTQAGVEIMYNTPYYGYSYMPATNTFFRQESTRTGNYPFLSAYLNIKLKRTRIFLMLDHFNSGLTGYNYFLVPSYPLNIMTFRYGIAWTFYD